MKATQELVTEHDAVLLALRILEKVEAAVAANREEAPEHLGQLVEFFRVFVDHCHHGKEEEALFPELERRGIPRDGGPIGVMLMEHGLGRERVAGMAAGLDELRKGVPGAVAAIRAHAAAYRDILRSHIHKENSVLFPMADRVVPADAADALAAKFEAIERDRIGAGRHEAFHAMLSALKGYYGTA
ncbi:MAG TPA: hemerythrin domain-containing protein [Vicinamibacterales bacterium]|nr:hemerythrin domain-containing protein [Vicinamibacterales bacterium]HPW21338.1 hemerythrin domain-containing protein [Vicinamibacterales bacterium]